MAAVGRREMTTDQAATVAVPRTGRPLRILLAEDNELNQRTARLMLNRLGHDVDVVEDGTQAVSAAVSGEYDLVLMDLQMPRLDGLAAARAIRALRSGDRPRIVAVTASPIVFDRRTCLGAGSVW